MTTEIVIFVLLFALVSGMGFVAARWRKPQFNDRLIVVLRDRLVRCAAS